MEESDLHNTVSVNSLTDSVDVSNACREFYKSRRKMADTVKEKLAASGRQQKTKTSLDTAILKLRTEMASLMDEDLGLMKQLLNLNETIEDLKWQKNNSVIQTPRDSSYNLTDSDWSVSETDMYESESDVEKMAPKQPMSFNSAIIQCEKTEAPRETIEEKDHFACDSETLSMNEESKVSCSSSKTTNRLSISLETRKFLELPTELDEFLNGPSSLSDEENSFDSGIHETDFWSDIQAAV